MRYRLLLKEILKYTELFENPTPDDQINDLENMVKSICIYYILLYDNLEIL